MAVYYNIIAAHKHNYMYEKLRFKHKVDENARTS